MPRFKCDGFSVDSAGNVLGSATVTAYQAATSNLAICYASESGAALAGSATTSNATTGYFEFWIDTADYASTQKFKYIVSKTGYTSVTVDNIQIIPYLYTELTTARGSMATLDTRLDVSINENGTLKSGAIGLVDLTGDVLATGGQKVFENGTDGTNASTIAEVQAENGDALVTSGTNRANSGVNVGTATIVSDATVGGTLGVTGVLTASGGLSGAVTGNVTGNLTGNVTGNVTGNLTGNVTGNLTGKASQVLISGSTASDGTHFQPMRGQYRNLVMSCTGNTTVTVTADEIIYHDAAADTRTAIRKTTFSNIADISTGVALNGLAVGLTEAPSTWYYIYAVTDGTNQKLCLSTVSNDLGAPTAFSGAWAGYTHWCRLGAVYNTSASHFRQFYQRGDVVNTTEVEVVTNDNRTTAFEVDLTAVIPSGVKLVRGFGRAVYATNAAIGYVFSYPSTTQLGTQLFAQVNSNATRDGSSFAIVPYSDSIWWIATDSVTAFWISVTGYEY